jgi:AcrR family transcriptional regulator
MNETPRPAPRPGLTRAAVLDAALAIARRDGLEALTMRRLAQHLGVQAMSLYNHVRDKRDVLDGMAGLVVAAIPRPDPDLPWHERLSAAFLALYRTFCDHPWLVTALVSEQTGLASLEVLRGMDDVLEVLEAAGLAPGQRVSAFRGMLALCLGLASAHTLGGRAAPQDALARFQSWDPRSWDGAGLPRLTALAPQFLRTTPEDDLKFMLDGYLAAVRAAGGA